MSLKFLSFLQDPQGTSLAESQGLARETSEGVLERTTQLWQELRHGGADAEDCWEIASGGISDHFSSIVDQGLGLVYDVDWTSQRIQRSWQEAGVKGLGQQLQSQVQNSETWQNVESKVDFLDALWNGEGSRLDAGLYLFHELAQVQLEHIGQGDVLSFQDARDALRARPDRIFDRKIDSITSDLNDKGALSTTKDILRGKTDLSAQTNVDFTTLGIRTGVVVGLATVGRGAGSKIARRLLASKPVQAQLARWAGTWGPGIVSGLEIGAAVGAGAGIEFTGQGLIATRQGLDWKSFAKRYWSDPKVWLKLGLSTFMLGGMRYLSSRPQAGSTPPPPGGQGGETISVIQTGAGTRSQAGSLGAATSSRPPSSPGSALVLTQGAPPPAAMAYEPTAGNSSLGGMSGNALQDFDWRSPPQAGDCSRFVEISREERMQIAQQARRATLNLNCVRYSHELDPHQTALELWEENPRISFLHQGSPLTLSFQASYWIYVYNELEGTNTSLRVRDLASGTEKWVDARGYVEGRSPTDLWNDPALRSIQDKFIRELSRARGEDLQERIYDTEVKLDRADGVIRDVHREAQEIIQDLADENEALRALLKELGMDDDAIHQRLYPDIVLGDD